ncbi:MAG: GNAT family N-acetyltransferase [Flavobacteriaceae bacterium]|nr:GNAT family N-acetyltransferase [Flavobacteriaceae bacterium]
MEGIQIREATPEDLAALLSLEQRLIQAERPFDPTIRQPPVVYYNLANLLKTDTFYVLVAEHDGQIVSCGYGTTKEARPYLDHAHYAYLGFMFTLEEYRGKGINKLIVDALVEWAKIKGLKEIRLTVYQDNIPAIKAYEKAGFVKHLIEMRIADRDKL